MITVCDPGELRASARFSACAVTIGNFDGVHVGHQELLRRTVSHAREHGLASVAVTFDPHPSFVLSPRPPRVLCSAAQRLEYMEEQGLDAALVLPFSRELAAKPADWFCSHVLQSALNVRELFVGYDFRMGHDRADAGRIRSLAQGRFAVTQVDAVLVDGRAVSSTRVREALEEGRLDDANTLLGRPFAVRGTVVHGAGRGGLLLGIPTANLDVPASMAMPASAVYATSARMCPGSKEEPWRMAVTSFCKNPTFGGNVLTLETHVMDFSADMYGCELEVRFLATLRKERRFEGLDALIAQLHADMRARREMPF